MSNLLNERNVYSQTLSSIRRSVTYRNQNEIADRLDFSLRAIYDQNREYNKSRSEAIIQPETIWSFTNQTLRNPRFKTIHSEDKPYELRVWESPNKDVLEKVNNKISGPHLQITNSGYSRKINGGHFTN